MKFFLIIISFFLFNQVLSGADLNQNMLTRLNEDYDKVRRLQGTANPNNVALETILAKKNEIFFDKIKKKVSPKDLSIIVKDIGTIKNSNSANIEKDYLGKIDSAKNVKLSSRNLKLLNDLKNTTQPLLHKGVIFASMTKNNKSNIMKSPMLMQKQFISMPTSSKNFMNVKNKAASPEVSKKLKEEIELEQIQSDALSFSLKENLSLESTEDDSLFTKVSKAYKRNLRKIIKQPK